MMIFPHARISYYKPHCLFLSKNDKQWFFAIKNKNNSRGLRGVWKGTSFPFGMNCQLILKELCSFFHKFVDRWLTSKTIPRKVDALISVIPYRWKNMRALCGVGVEEKNRSHLRYGSLMASNAKYARRVCIKQIPTHFDGSFRTKWNPPPSFCAISRGKRHWHLLAGKKSIF